MPDFAVASRLVAELIRRIFSAPQFHSQSSKTKQQRPIELLEVGAGLGGTTKYILDALITARIPFRLTYSDISPSFVAAARLRYEKQYTYTTNADIEIEYTTLDIEQSPPPPNMVGRFDAIISLNCFHATMDLAATCRNARGMLRPARPQPESEGGGGGGGRTGGFLALIEITDRIPWLDLVFGFMKGWWLFDDGRTHCLADEDFWRSSLEAAGFKRVLVHEDVSNRLQHEKSGSSKKQVKNEYKPNPQVIVAY